ncbi:maleylpyruvate isomerase family mycothiol-dependent enzyme [Actinomadura sp. HBU206391]|uniref:maleylpyruvate isomerase family mycothiol-dependent enzyme n=1 Tax=Actinomadura sp. HBU206391 TaxID=2731692 RepID=UPI00164EDD7D|nr:maleylpyruvate isomerase family mycothiol-dependent enzyme [Actinomadura sp. HBU206391]MBC6459928.1 maleylpyruvate isomerase family mycothiol-dependent enzyme [Actinomadura sp. HBU206391]
MTDIFDDLAAEYRQLDAVLAALTQDQWSRPSGAEGWTVSDVVLHLTQTEEVIADPSIGEGKVLLSADESAAEATVDGLADEMVAAERGMPAADLLVRWRTAAFATADALRAYPAGTRLSWVRAPISPRTLATTRLAEHWAHAQDITVPLGISYADTDRLRHVAWLAHRTLPYAFAVAGLADAPVFCDLTAPDGTRWTFGDPAAPARITGPASEFCRVGARRLTPEQTSLTAEGPHAADALRVVRNYAA